MSLVQVANDVGLWCDDKEKRKRYRDFFACEALRKNGKTLFFVKQHHSVKS